MRFESVLEGHRAAKMSPGAAQEAEKGPQMLTLGCLRADFWCQNDDTGTLLKHRYLLHFQPKIHFWDHPMPTGTKAYGNFSPWLAT